MEAWGLSDVSANGLFAYRESTQLPQQLPLDQQIKKEQNRKASKLVLEVIMTTCSIGRATGRK